MQKQELVRSGKFDPMLRQLDAAIQAVQVGPADPLLADAVKLLFGARTKVQAWVNQNVAAPARPEAPESVEQLTDQLHRAGHGDQDERPQVDPMAGDCDWYKRKGS